MENLNDDVLSLIFEKTNPKSLNHLQPFFPHLIKNNENYYYQCFLKNDYHLQEPKTERCKSIYQSLENLDLSGDWTIQNEINYENHHYLQEYETKIIYDKKHQKFNATGTFQDFFLPTNTINFKIAGYLEKYNLQIKGIIYFSTQDENTHHMSFGKSTFQGNLNYQKFKENILEINSQYEFASDTDDFSFQGKTLISKKTEEPK